MSGLVWKLYLRSLANQPWRMFPASKVWSDFGDGSSCTVYSNYGIHIHVWSLSCHVSKFFAKALVYPAASWNSGSLQMMDETHKWFWYGDFFMPPKDRIIGLDLKQIEHPK